MLALTVSNYKTKTDYRLFSHVYVLIIDYLYVHVVMSKVKLFLINNINIKYKSTT